MNRVVPELAYGVSGLAQLNTNKVGEVTVHHATEMRKLVKRLKVLKDRGRARLYVRKLDLSSLACLTYFDASFAQEEGFKSQGGMFTVLTDVKVVSQPVLGNLVEYESSTIRRVVRSTMAAESAALSKSLDRQLYLRLMIESLLYGQPELRDTDWRLNLRVPGILVTDAKSLYDNLQKDGSLPAERQTLLDVLVAKDLVEQKCIDVRWLANSHQFADFLTKPEVVTPNLQTFLRYGTLSLVPTQAQEADEAHRLELRRGQRLRAKERKEARKSAPVSIAAGCDPKAGWS